MSTRARACLLAGGLWLVFSGPLQARELWTAPDREASLKLKTALKSSLLLSHAPADSPLYPQRDSTLNLWRLRVDLEARPLAWLTADLAYEHRLRTPVSGGYGTASLLGAESEAPYRLWQGDWGLLEGEETPNTAFAWRHELDRAFVAFHASAGELTVGRQAVGWGRGMVFNAVDIFVPFSPLEVDREWRRGIDALRGDFRLSDTLSLDTVVALGAPSEAVGTEHVLEGSVLASRLRGYLGRADGELLGGWRAGDWFTGATVAAAVGDAEVHAEGAAFWAQEPLAGGGVLGRERLALKAVAGVSYNLGVGKGIRVLGEYLYSSFGLTSLDDLYAVAADPDFQKRLSRGDFSILGRHALALQASYSLSDYVGVSLLGMGSPRDGSGVGALSLSWVAGDNLSLAGGLYLPWGARPEGLQLQSEYGASPVSGFLQVRLYD